MIQLRHSRGGCFINHQSMCFDGAPVEDVTGSVDVGGFRPMGKNKNVRALKGISHKDLLPSVDRLIDVSLTGDHRDGFSLVSFRPVRRR